MTWRSRCRQPERMDEPGLSPGEHARALHSLARINAWSRTVATLWSFIRHLPPHGKRPRRLLDVGCGAGDVLTGLWRKAKRAGWELEADGWDVSPLAVNFARDWARRNHAAVRFHVVDALGTTTMQGYDVIVSSLFLHHLSEPDAVELLKRMREGAEQMVLISDLERRRLGLALAFAGTRLLSWSSVVWSDGPISVRAAFTVEEARAIAVRAGLAGATLTRTWPCRFLLCWKAAHGPCHHRSG